MDSLSDAVGGGALPDDREILAALALADIPGLGLSTLRALVDELGSFLAVLAAGRRGGLKLDAGAPGRGDVRTVVRSLRRLQPASRSRLDELRSRDFRVAVYGSAGYPPCLRHLPDPPPVLYLQGAGMPGDPLLPEREAVAIVGTRAATEYGRRVARDLSAGLAEAGWVVLSGMARGIDAAAHRAALDAGRASVGVLGSGFDHEYPAGNRRLYRRMRDHGILVTEFAPADPPLPFHFPRRNRIIAALSAGVVVVQAGRKSGALNTAGHALDLGREVFAVPGPVGSPASEGVHGLLRDGAVLAADVRDVAEALGGAGATGPARSGTTAPGRGGPAHPEAGAPDPSQPSLPLAPVDARDEPWRGVWEQLQAGARSVDSLLSGTGLSAGELVARLTRWELAGLVESVAGDRYRALSSADGPA